jgi:hypothetical protein
MTDPPLVYIDSDVPDEMTLVAWRRLHADADALGESRVSVPPPPYASRWWWWAPLSLARPRRPPLP